jgi:hypothetical protein
MGLAKVDIPASDFNVVYQHISSYAPTDTKYGNMHLRQTRQQDKTKVLRYLHAMRVRPNSEKAIEGMICGPGLLWAYELLPGRTAARLVVSIDESTVKESERIERQFLKEIRDRVAEEQGSEHPSPSLTRGHFYLRRRRPPMSVTHPTCKKAIDSKIFDLRFLSRILPWGFRLIVGGASE